MKQILVVAIALIASFNSFSQNTKALSEEKAANWFKSFYVDLNFKDPYSYKLAKVSIDTFTAEEKIREDISSQTLKMDYSDKIDMIGLDNSIARYAKLSKKEKTPSTYTTLYNSEVRKKQEIQNRPALIQKLKSDLEKMSLDEKNKVLYYKIYLDCHANNSYGNPVLGKYLFTFSDGYYDPQSIVKLND